MNPYRPEKAVIKRIRETTYDSKIYSFELVDEERREGLCFKPGQFIMLTVFGVGEAAFSLSSHPGERSSFDCTVRSVGTVTRALARLTEGDLVGVRGPFGQGWPMEKAQGRNLLIVAGGCGLAPVRPVIASLAQNSIGYRNLEILYGARTPADLYYTDEYDGWRRIRNASLRLTVDAVPSGVVWNDCVGVVTTLFDQMQTKPDDALVFTCGPEIMMSFVIRGLASRGFLKEQIYLSLERVMRCGIGKCGHCMIGPRFVCRHGPVFNYTEIEQLLDKIL